MSVAIGSTVWRFNSNRRVYSQGKSGPVWREHWDPLVVVGETSRSWLVAFRDGGKVTHKAPKRRDWLARKRWAYSEHEIDVADWAESKRYEIIRALERADPDDLYRVACIVALDVATAYPTPSVQEEK